MLLLGHPGDVNEGAAVARIDGERGLEQVLGLFELARGDRRPRLLLELGWLSAGAASARPAAPISKTRAKDCIKLSINLRRLARTPQPRDEKSVSAIVGRSYQLAGTIGTPRSNGRRLTNPR
jgi:hypothetical protein